MLLESYEAVVKEIFTRLPKWNRKDFHQTEELLHAFNDPHTSFAAVHIAGTNGKGTVAGKIARTLQLAGHKVGLFTSPHLFDYRERIQVNGTKIPKEEVCLLHEELNAYLAHASYVPNFFESTFLYACRYFEKEGVDIAVMETGMGGKLDPTNVVTPLVSVITSVSMDHIDRLGPTLQDIAVHKAGILKPKIPAVIGPYAHFAPIYERAKKLGCELREVKKKTCFYDTENTLIAREALEVISKTFPISKKAMREGLKYTPPCRFEKHGNVIYDVAHNPDGFSRLADALGRHYPYRKFRFVIGMGKGKNYRECLQKIVRKASHIHFVQAKNRETASPKELGSALELISSCPYTLEESVREGFDHANAAANDELIVVCGSFYIMEDCYQKV